MSRLMRCIDEGLTGQTGQSAEVAAEVGAFTLPGYVVPALIHVLHDPLAASIRIAAVMHLYGLS
jgi:hypothetical protein